MRLTACPAAVFGGLLVLLLLPGVVSAHEITDVHVDCADRSIVVSGDSFGGGDGTGVTVTVSGPEGYVQTFVAEPSVPWTVSLPLGPSGIYTIEWPDSDGGAVTFVVDCPDESLPPPTPAATPSKTPDHGVPASPHHTLPPTDTGLPSSAAARTDTAVATLLFIAVFAAAVALRRTAQRRTWRR
jgi:hypothetical protein